MFLPGAVELGLTNNQCLTLVESVEDTLIFFCSRLTFLIDSESRQAAPDVELISTWEALDTEVFDLRSSLPGADAQTYQRILELYTERNVEMREIENRYLAQQRPITVRL